MRAEIPIKAVLNHLGAQDPGRYFRSAFWLTASKFASMAVSLLATFYIARALGPQNFGELSYAQSVLAIFTILSASIGALYRDLIKKPEEENQLLGTAWFIYFFISLLSILAVMAYVLITPHDQLSILVISILCVTQFFSPFSVIQNVFYVKTETKWLSVCTFVLHVFISSVKIAVMINGQGVAILATVIVLEQALMAIIYLSLYKLLHHGSIRKWKINLSYAKKLLADSVPIVIVAASGIISARIDQIFLKNMADMQTVGLYGMAIQLSEIWQYLPALVLTALFPTLINAGNEIKLYQKRLRFFCFGLIIYGLSVSATLTLIAPKLINFIYGPAFAPGVSLLQIYSWSITGMIVGLLVTQFLLAENFRKIQVVTAAVPMLLNILLNLILIPVYGAVGAAYATVISYSLYPLLPFMYTPIRQRLLFSPTAYTSK